MRERERERERKRDRDRDRDREIVLQDHAHRSMKNSLTSQYV